MNEAKYSLNLKFELGGYNAQLTMRSDDSYGEIVDQMKSALGMLGQGPKAKPATRPAPQPKKDPVPVPAHSPNGAGPPKCPDHGRAAKSRFGGLYCTGIMEYQEDGTPIYCQWKSKES